MLQITTGRAPIRSAGRSLTVTRALPAGDTARLGVLIGLVTVAAVVGGVATRRAIPGWYDTLDKPSWNPPNWVFAPAWTVLYLVMSVAGTRVLRPPAEGRPADPEVERAGRWWLAQLVANGLWSVLFFGLRSPLLGTVGAVALWGLVVGTTWTFWRRDRKAGLMLVPYVAWVSFATVLTAVVWRLNG